MTDRPRDPAARPAPAARRAVLPLAVGAALLVYALDQLTKWWAVAQLVPGVRVPVVDGLLWWQFIRNPGAAFSLGEDITWVFTLVMAVVSVAVAVTLRRVRSRAWALALGLVLGGALGNLTDRLLREPGFGVGHVVDFIAVPRFAIFNVADCGVVVGVGLVVLLTLLGRELDGTRTGRGAGGTAAPGDGQPAGAPGPEEQARG
ncbi:signal peptidase II [Kocuria flava]|uniref:signal peptidase II n=1 Tax=Kocuria flava TaxID=446860 RepID=UPI001FF6B138|nr:signal peptidase II [Kocuria flava]MCJ8505844.1 signal peptidase II [Kocuria flava]